MPARMKPREVSSGTEVRQLPAPAGRLILKGGIAAASIAS
jgi:hypothetical protein